MPTNQRRADRIRNAYRALVREGMPADLATYVLAVERIDRLASLRGAL